MDSQELATLLAFATAMSFSPGPNTMLSASLAANLGLRGAARFVVAVPAGWTLMMLACGLGLGALVVAMPWMRTAVKAAGCWPSWPRSPTTSMSAGGRRAV